VAILNPRNALETVELHISNAFSNDQPPVYIFSLMCSSIMGGFMASGQGVVEHYYVLARVQVCLTAAVYDR
jgi:hypothetical protein